MSGPPTGGKGSKNAFKMVYSFGDKSSPSLRNMIKTQKLLLH